GASIKQIFSDAYSWMPIMSHVKQFRYVRDSRNILENEMKEETLKVNITKGNRERNRLKESTEAK
ncbi:MAG TPA: hypothetical protein VFQ23_15445, partial [Anaerolineales bacterium]|nr:hypothetical protein [Anaerolineales bacterium]